MKLEGGSNVKSPWYYRTGSRPIGATRQLTYIAAGVGPHALTVRAQASVTSTLNIYLGNVAHASFATASGSGALIWGTGIAYDPTTYGFSFGGSISFSLGNGTLQAGTAHLDEHMTVAGDTVYIVSVDTVVLAHAVTYNTIMSMEYYGK